MKAQISRLTALSMVLLLLPAPDWATCGGGGGGGMGGMRSGGPAPGGGSFGDQQVYQVPWKVIKPDDTPIAKISALQPPQLAQPLSLRFPVRHHGCC